MTSDPRSAATHDALHQLDELGWRRLGPDECQESRGGKREVLFGPRLIGFLKTRSFEYKGQRYPLSADAIDQVLRELSAVALGDGLLAANERLYTKLVYGISVTEFMPDGKKYQPTVALVDWTHPEANHFDLTEESASSIVCYVNGIPLVVIEAGQPESSDCGEAAVREGIERHLRNQSDDGVSHLYAYAQLLLSIDCTLGRYGTTRTPARFWARWNRDEEFDDSLNERDRLLKGLLMPSRLLELLRGFVLFDRRIGKVVARPPQFFGVRAMLKRLAAVNPAGSREGGVVWHATGSGKSFTMVFLAKALLLSDQLKQCRIVVVTDRLSLERQLIRNFMSSGAFGLAHGMQKDGERSKAISGRDLARRIGHGTERITFAMVQKFNTASRLPECRNPSPDMIVLIDEAHRSHGGDTHARMRRVLPNAACVAFTGTPLLADEKAANRFGPIVHAYSMRRAIDDGVVAPLLYEERVPELVLDAEAVDRWFDAMVAGMDETRRAEIERQARRASIHGAADRIALIAWDIALHFNEHVRKIAPGMKGQIATSSKRDAIRYKKALDSTGLVTSAVVISPPDACEGQADEDADDRAEIREWWKQNIPAGDRDGAEHERQVLHGFASGDEPDLLIVVDRLLTGFDEPRNAVLYIDKPLKRHNLMQAVARVNRLHESKRHGLLVDYRGILKELDATIRAYQDLEARTQGGFDVEDLAGLYAQVATDYARLPALRDAARSLSARTGDRDDFRVAVEAFGACMRTALSSRGFFRDAAFPEALIARYKRDLRELIDMRVNAMRVREPAARYLVHRLADAARPQEWSEKKTRDEAALLRTRLQWSIEHDLAGDPRAQKRFSAQLADAIREAEALFDHPHEQYALLREVEHQIDLRAPPTACDALADDPQAGACLGAIRLVLGDDAYERLDAELRDRFVDHARAFSAVVRNALAEHSLDPQAIEAAIRKDLLVRLHGDLGLEKASEVIAHVLRSARAGSNFAP